MNKVIASMSDQGILHNAEPLVPKAMQVCTMENGEKFVQCLWCPCRFSNVKDFNVHIEAFGKSEEKHRENWRGGKWRHELPEDSDSS